MVKRNDGRRRKPLRRKKAAYGKNIDGVRHRRVSEPKRKFINVNHVDMDYIETE